MTYPKISIVTPSLNQGEFLEAAINSVLGQNYVNLEYVIIDGGSTDGSVDIIERYASDLTYWISEPDSGHANALNKGFARTTGEIMGWLNSDDVLHPGALSLLAEIFSEYDEIEWLTGQQSNVDTLGRTVAVYPPGRWSRLRYLTGDYRWIQQESTYWRRRLWDKAGGYISEDHSMACDLELWVRFFRYAKLYSTYGLIGAFRFNPDRRTRQAMDVYVKEADEIVRKEIAVSDIPESEISKWARYFKYRKRYPWIPRRWLDPDTWAGSPAPVRYDWILNRFENPNRRRNEPP